MKASQPFLGNADALVYRKRRTSGPMIALSLPGYLRRCILTSRARSAQTIHPLRPMTARVVWRI